MSFFSSVDADKQRRLGTEARDIAGNIYKYLSGVASLAATDFVTYDEAFATTRLVASGKGPVAVALSAPGAGDYGWFQVEGTATANVGTSLADNAKLYATAIAGRADDAAVTGDQVLGAIARSAESGNLATVQINRPWIGMTDATS
jgi:hypothetical protein